MSIKLIARELYQLRRKVEALETRLESASFEKRAVLEQELLRARDEMRQMRKILDGRIDR